jgi:hypothetical protein
MKRHVIGKKILFLIKIIGINMIRMHLHHRIQGVQDQDKREIRVVRV